MPQLLSEQTRAIFKSWEVLRIFYNGVLVVLSCALMAGMLDELMDNAKWVTILPPAIFAAIAANVCYFLGPIAEAYLTWLGWRFTGLRGILFAAGLLFSMLVVVVVFSVVHFADMAMM